MDLFDTIAAEAARADHEDRYVALIKGGEFVRQGDVYLTALENTADARLAFARETQRMIGWEDFRLEPLGEPTENRQLAPGSTQGSRHMVSAESMNVVQILAARAGAHPCEGPVLIASGRWRLEHPEHADCDMPEGIYQVTFQRDLAFEEAQRVAD